MFGLGSDRGKDVAGGVGEGVGGGMRVSADGQGDLLEGRSVCTIFLMLLPVRFCR